jgi:hypothetical protein
MNEKTFRYVTPGVKNDIVSPKNTRLQKICQHLIFFTKKQEERCDPGPVLSRFPPSSPGQVQFFGSRTIKKSEW